MLGKQKYQHQLIDYFDLETFISKGHLLRKVEQHINLGFVREMTEQYYCLNNGRPSIDPELFFRMVLIGYLYNIQSDRQLCEEIHYNLAYRWFCKLNLENKVPDHSSLTRIRDRFGLEVFESVFNKIVEQCKINGLVKSESVMTDGTLFHANASMDSLSLRNKKETQCGKEAQTDKQVISERKNISNKTHVSRTDPDATLAVKNRKPPSLKYKAHISIDAKSRVIVDTKVTTGACHDSQVYLERLENIHKTHDINISKAIADRAYGSGEILRALIDKNIEPIIPLFHSKSGSIMKEADGFIFEEENNRYRCLANKYLVPFPSKLSDGRVTYHSSGRECKKCTIQEKCTANLHNKYHMRVIRRSIHQKLFEQMLVKMETEEFYRELCTRFWKIEGIISEAKNRHCLGRAKYHGLAKTQIQAYMSASAQNIKRLVIAIFYLYYFIFNKMNYKIKVKLVLTNELF